MNQVRRLLAAGGIFLAGAAILTCTQVWGDPGRDKELRDWHKGGGKAIAPPRDDALAEEFDRNRFEDRPVVVYERGGEALFGLQVKPRLPDAPAQPTDYLVLIDTSASKAMGPLAASIEIARELAGALGRDDRMAVWTANVKPRDVSRGFKAAQGLEGAFNDLAKETPLGAVGLKRSIAEPLASFEVKPGRRRVLVFFGDGKSVADPLDDDGRAELCEALVKRRVAFLAVPMGPRPDSRNLHGLVAGSGGKVVRHGIGEATSVVAARLRRDAAEPVLYPESFRVTAGAADVLPTRMPPLRRDAATLVVGKLPAGAKALDWAVTGTAAGAEFKGGERLAVPAADADNFFLAGVHDQWLAGKDRPALLPADRALAFSHMQNALAVEDLVARAELCLEQNKLDAAGRLFEQARQLAPHAAAAKGGLMLVERMRAGKRTRQEMLEELRLNAARRELLRVEARGQVRKVEVLNQAAQRDADRDKPADDLPPPRDPIEDVRMRRQIAEEQATLAVNEAVRQANRVVRTDPDGAYELLKRTRDGIAANADLDPRAVTNLSGRLSTAMEGVARQGAIVKRDQAEALALRAAADARLDLRRAEAVAQDRLRERMRVFRNLMDQAREEEAFRQALSIRNDLVGQGQRVPPSVTAAYQTAITGYHAREVAELKRLTEERWLATLLEVDRSAVPYPDEPPVEFPSSAVIKRITRFPGKYGFDNWGDLSAYRIKRASLFPFTGAVPPRMFEIKNVLETPIDYPGTDGPDPRLTLAEVLDQLSQAHKVPIFINEKAFKYEAQGLDIQKAPVADREALPRMTKTPLGTVLKKVLSRVQNIPSEAVYQIRQDSIEVTTGFFASAEKVIRTYPVGDLVYPVPSAFNQQAVGQAGSLLGTLGQLGIVGQALGAGGLQVGAQLGGLGALGALGGGLGALGGGVGALGGGLGARPRWAAWGRLGGGGLQLGAAAGVGQAGGPAGLQVGGFNFQGNQNLGVGGGNLGITGGQLGQLGNLGGQFGIQGGTQEQLLITLIRQVVGRPKDWATQVNPITGQPLNPLDEAPGDGTLQQDNNALGYYGPAASLVVKAPSRLHNRESNLIIQPAAGPAPGMAAAPGGGRPAGGAVAAGKGRGDRPLDPREVWQDALARGVTDPGLVIATTDFLATNLNRFDHVAEFLKANLRQGVLVRPWVYQSLAVALRQTGGSAEEIERAEVSAADLQPLDARGYLVAARALAEDRNYERALSFCKQAADLSPGVPHAYADASRYAEMARDAGAMRWATAALLRQDWPHRDRELRQGALDRIESLAGKLGKAEGDRLRGVAQGQRRRDLVIKLVWQGEADLDLKVEEPTGSVCTPLARQTIGGGTLVADTAEAAESYAAAEAFSGEYRVLVERVWGKPLGGKAQLKVIRHQGTPDETEELVTVRVSGTVAEPVAVRLAGGRRTRTASVPPAAAHEAPGDAAAPLDPQAEVLFKLGALATADRAERGAMQAGVAGAGRPVPRPGRPTPTRHEGDRTVYQNRVQPFVADSMELTAQAVLSADRRSVRVSVAPVVNTLTDGPARVVSPVIPGGPPR
ncbi:MAG: vWA domain-containing protein [Gemmataceae bacterium]